MSDGSTEVDLHLADLALHDDQQGRLKSKLVTCGTIPLYIYAPVSEEALIHAVMQKAGIAYRLNDYRVCLWSRQHKVCFFQFDRLNTFQKSLLEQATAKRAEVTELQAYLEVGFGWVEVDLLHPDQLLTIDKRLPVMKGQKWRIRTWLGKLLALVILLLTAPLSVLVAVAIKLDSGGPVFFRQLRTGLHNREFQILKFRSMSQDAERDGAQWAVEDDKRITRVGSILRKTRFDEVPQLVNVIRGDMALIGPRPEREVFICELEKAVPFYRFRHLVKPGITGLAQVSCGYGASIEDARQKHRYDLYYIKHQSLWLDLKILWQTLNIVLTGKGT